METAFALPPDATGPTRRPWPRRRYKSIRDYAIALILRVDKINEDGREIGFSYEHIRRSIVQKFPTVTYHGPHTGKPVSSGFRSRQARHYYGRTSAASEYELHDLYQITYSLNLAGIRLPSRPRSGPMGRYRKQNNGT